MNYNITEFFIGKLRDNVIFLNKNLLYPSYINIYDLFYEQILNSISFNSISYNIKYNSFKDPQYLIQNTSNVTVDKTIHHNLTVIDNIHQKLTLTFKLNSSLSIIDIYLYKIEIKNVETINYSNVKIELNTPYTYIFEYDNIEHSFEIGDKIYIYFKYTYKSITSNTSLYYIIETQVSSVNTYDTYTDIGIENIKVINLRNLNTINNIKYLSENKITKITYRLPDYDNINVNSYDYYNYYTKFNSFKNSLTPLYTTKNDYININSNYNITNKNIKYLSYKDIQTV